MAYANIAEFRADLAIDLNDASNAIWSTAELDRAIGHAVNDIALAVGLSATEDLSTIAGAKDYDITSYTDILRIDGVEYLVGEEPQSWVQYWVYEGKLRLLIDEAPSDTSGTIRIFYTKKYTVDATGSDLPEESEELALLGAKAYCLLQEGVGAIPRANVDEEAAERYHRAGLDAMGEFQRRLGEVRAERFRPPHPSITPAWWGKPIGWDRV